MKTAVLCNGNSRVMYHNQTNKYDYVIGCNIPWTQVDSTVILDVEVLNKFETPIKFYCSRNAWRELKNRDKFINYLIELFDPIQEYDSTGHAATRIVIQLGATEVDVYGCDSLFVNNTDSYTHQFVDSRSIDIGKNVIVWRSRWKELINNHPHIKFNFIGEPH